MPQPHSFHPQPQPKPQPQPHQYPPNPHQGGYQPVPSGPIISQPLADPGKQLIKLKNTVAICEQINCGFSFEKKKELRKTMLIKKNEFR